MRRLLLIHGSTAERFLDQQLPSWPSFPTPGLKPCAPLCRHPPPYSPVQSRAETASRCGLTSLLLEAPRPLPSTRWGGSFTTTDLGLEFNDESLRRSFCRCPDVFASVAMSPARIAPSRDESERLAHDRES